MKQFHKIVTFGDSFAWGDELLAPGQTLVADHGNQDYREQHCYTGILAQHYGVPAENLAFPGGSCQSTRWIYTWWLQQERDPASCLVLVQLSGPWRSSQFDRHRVPHGSDPEWNQFIHSTWIEHYQHANRLAYEYFRMESELADCDQRYRITQAETYLFFQGQQPDVGMLLMFNSQCESLDHAIRPKSLLWPDTNLEQLLDQEPIWAPNGHLDERGHERVANLLIREIDCAILAQ